MDNFNFFKINNEHGHKYTERWLKIHKPKIIIMLNEFLKTNEHLIGVKFNNKLWHLMNNTNIVPKCHCGNDLKFINVKNGYTINCSVKCTVDSPLTKQRRKETTLEKYGVEYYTQTDEYIEKNKKTCLEKYGVENVNYSEEIRNKIIENNLIKYGVEHIFQADEIKDKIKSTKLDKYDNETYNNPEQRGKTLKVKYSDEAALNEFLDKQKSTNLLRYGNEYANKTDAIKTKNIENTKKTLLEKYGVDNPYKIESVIKGIQDKNTDSFKKRYPDLEFISYNKNTKEHTIKCDKCGEFNTNSSLLYTRYVLGHEICVNCNQLDKHYSEREKEVLRYIESLNLNTEIINTDKSILGGKHLDIYIPAHKLAIEFDGLYWHNELRKPDNYHLDKTEGCEEKGIQLIHIFEDEWVHKRLIVKSRLKNILGLTENKIFARKCKIKEVNIKDTKEFLNNNHIQGYSHSTTKIGLYFNNELVSLMCFIKRNNKKESFIELSRFCNKLDTSIVGGADKLLKHYIKMYSPNNVVSYSDRRWSQGELYKTLGFKLTNINKPTYSYIVNDIRYHKFNFRKDKKEKVYNEDGSEKTEHEIMLEKKIYRIYDCGLLRWDYTPITP